MLRYSDVTPKHLYLNRRRFLSTVGALALPSAAMAAKIDAYKKNAFDSGGEKPSPKETVTTYNNFYEFGTGKEDPSINAPKWKPNAEWPIRLEGAVKQAKTLSLDQVMKLAPLEERIYRLRCVERWSVVVPWIGIPLSALLKQVEPTGNAKYVAFESYYNSQEMLSPRSLSIREFDTFLLFVRFPSRQL